MLPPLVASGHRFFRFPDMAGHSERHRILHSNTQNATVHVYVQRRCRGVGQSVPGSGWMVREGQDLPLMRGRPTDCAWRGPAPCYPSRQFDPPLLHHGWMTFPRNRQPVNSNGQVSGQVSRGPGGSQGDENPDAARGSPLAVAAFSNNIAPNSTLGQARGYPASSM